MQMCNNQGSRNCKKSFFYFLPEKKLSGVSPVKVLNSLMCLVIKTGFIGHICQRAARIILMDHILQTDNRSEFFWGSAYCLAEPFFQRALANMQLLQQILYPDIAFAFVNKCKCRQYKLIGFATGHSFDQEFLNGCNTLSI